MRSPKTPAELNSGPFYFWVRCIEDMNNSYMEFLYATLSGSALRCQIILFFLKKFIQLLKFEFWKFPLFVLNIL
jgi:hypothetical protein